MNIKNLVVVTSFPGVQKIVANRNNGMLVEDMDTGKVRFAPMRKHQFSPLETISIFTDDDDSVELKVVFQKMLDQIESNPPVDVNSPSPALRAYFTAILPNHDPEQVHISDIKKAIKWFNFLHERGYTTMEEPASDEEE